MNAEKEKMMMMTQAAVGAMAIASNLGSWYYNCCDCCAGPIAKRNPLAVV
jgi:hypothetical protein